MFKTAGLLVLSILFGDAQTVRFRPPEGSVPWHNTTVSEPTWSKPDWDVNYFVPDFGPDQDVIDTKKDIQVAEKQLKTKLNASFNATELEKKFYAENPRDYFVPNFGADEDMINVKDSIKLSEDTLGHTFSANFSDGKDLKLNPRNYFVPDFGVDQDIIDSTTSIKNSEQKLGKQFTADFGFGKDADKELPRDYFVPHFGVDQDIKNVQNSIAVTEKTLSHTWTPTQDKNGYWSTPSAADNSSYGYNQNVFVNHSGF